MPDCYPISERYLTMVTANNNNKFYRMIPSSDNTSFRAIYGRIGTNGTTLSYPIGQWCKKYREKIDKGYVDQTELFDISSESGTRQSKGTLSAAEQLIRKLSEFARGFIKRTYTINLRNITPLMVRTGEDLLMRLKSMIDTGDGDVQSFNEILCRLFMAVPRQMQNTVKSNIKNTNKWNLRIANKTNRLFRYG